MIEPILSDEDLTTPERLLHKTNGDVVNVVVGDVARRAVDLVTWARTHPDEAVVAAAPMFLILLASLNGRQRPFQLFILTEVGYWAGLASLRQYQAWKKRPAVPLPLKAVNS